MWVLGRLAFTFFLVFSTGWAVFPGGFGTLHFRESHPGLAGQLARLCWWFVLLVHPLALYRVWSGDVVGYWLAALVAMHVLFFLIFVRNVGTR
ncbi:hypothetical protein ASD55_00875 [Rhodanobacter sp. Root561]|uniref:hypothetical protein n=1 Tax=Rhodanobacter sp. Root561 TaxID=1736560 RepID=UPI0006F758FE|nr:hypothetical protein [Rhodanobacter sp. Root561]KQZ79304.1 hypothetical protein ASD55_00875 [Rhodanobacter sp. Root561]